MNKQLWSPSYMFFTAGCSGFLLVAFYAIFDLELNSDGACPCDGDQSCLLPSLAPASTATTTAAVESETPPPPPSPPLWQRVLQAVFTPARWVGLNTMFVYLMGPSGGVFYGLQSQFFFNGNRCEKRLFLSSFLFKKDPFTKTGSGQT
jgi:hypothetical protein